MAIAVEIDPDPHKLKELSFLSSTGCADITDTGDMDASIEIGAALQAGGIRPIVNVACGARKNEEIMEYIDRAYNVGIMDVLVLAGNNWNRSARPTDIIKFTATHYPRMNVGSVVNQYAPSFSKELETARRKADSGARFMFTQPFWHYGDAEMFYQALGQGRGLPAEIYWGIFAAKDYGSIPRMAGLYVPEHIVEQSRNGTTGVEISRQLLHDFTSHGEHVYLMGRRYKTIEKILL